MGNRWRVWWTVMVAGAACAHPMQRALDEHDVTAACRAGLASMDEGRNAQMARELAAQTRLRWQVERVPPGPLGLGEKHPGLFRATVVLTQAPPGSRVRIRPPAWVENRSIQTLAPLGHPDGQVAWTHAVSYLDRPEPPSLEWVPAQYLPRQYVEEKEPGKWVYKPDVDPQAVLLMLATGGLSALLPQRDVGGQWVEADPRERAAWTKRQAAERKAFEAAEQARLKQSAEVIASILARNQAAQDQHKAALAAHAARLAELERVWKPAACPVEDSAWIALERDTPCTFVSAWVPGLDLLSDAPGPVVRTDVEYRLGPDACLWTLRGSVELPPGGGVGTVPDVLGTASDVPLRPRPAFE